MLKPKKSLGQHFLIDQTIARKIVDVLKLNPEDVLLEIGPGEGALTHFLAHRTKKLLLVEVDRRAIRRLMEQYQNEAVEILEKDFLEIDLREIAERLHHKLRVVGNIPYYITTPILFKVLEQRDVVLDLTIMVQREVAQRIVASPGSKTYGILSVFCQYYAEPRLLFTVKPGAFFPRPKVNSAVLSLTFPQEPKATVRDESLFVHVVRATFGKRRKMLRKSLPYISNVSPELLATLDFDLKKRPEQLSLEEFADLSNQLSRILTDAQEIEKS